MKDMVFESLDADQARVARFARDYLISKIDNNRGQPVFGEVQITLVYRGGLKEVRVNDTQTFRTNDLMSDERLLAGPKS